MRYVFAFFFIIVALFSCQEKSNKKECLSTKSEKLFSKVPSSQSNIFFTNTIKEDLSFNFINYPPVYSGAGVAVGDIDNDGLEDIYFVSNFGKNKLYKNKGDFKFEDITDKANINSYSGFDSGVTMLDINNDGWLDIYLCKAGSLGNDEGRRNKLFINQKNGTFKEEAKKWGLDDPGYTTQVFPFDYDNDGDLDLYVLNYRYDFRNNTKISGKIQSQIEEITSDQLYRNDGNYFTKVTGEAGLYNKAWGLGVAIADINNDGWEDIYVSNDYLEPDVIYINQKNGTFKNQVLKRFKHISFNSMGSDIADINNDLFPDLITLDMLAEKYARAKENMASMSTANFNNMVKIGYHHAYMANMLHLNTGNGTFQEIGQVAGITKTDWSWTPLLADFNNDGLKDLFVSNGIFKDVGNRDFKNTIKLKNARGESITLKQLKELMPSEKLNNYIFKNNGDLTFTKKIKEWGLEDPGFSHGAVYADLDNDGDLDLITNNVEGEVGLYKNNSENNYLQIRLKGSNTNTFAIGSKVYLLDKNFKQLQQLYLSRGYESSVTPILHFGLDDVAQVDTLIVQWNDGKTTTLTNVKANQRLTISYDSATNKPLAVHHTLTQKTSINPITIGIDYTHQENDFNDYALQLLIPQKQSTKGTKIAVGDVNGDGLDDFFVGNAQGSPAALYIQKKDGTFTASNTALWKKHATYEDANAQFFDADGDGDMDLYVVSAGYNLPKDSPLLQDRLYFNNGKGIFTHKPNALPEMHTSGKALAIADYDNDGDPDIFIGGNVIPGKYPLPPHSYLLQNNNGKFVNKTPNNQDLDKIGMVTDACFTDYDTDGDLDLLVVGEWMKPTIFNNQNGHFSKTKATSGFQNQEGWWFSVTAADFDGDGDQDYVLGNLGHNNKFHPSEKKPLYIYAKDFDDNGTFDVALSKINDGRLVPVRGKECSSEQNPFLLDKIQTYKQFAHLDMNDIYGKEKLKAAFKLTAHNFKTVYAQNLGDGSFKITQLPNQAQVGPTMATLATDVNNDGKLDIIGIGNLYDAEVETIRYDSNLGYVLLGDGNGNFSYAKELNPLIDKDTKDIKKITINNTPYFIVVSNNAPLEIFNFKS